MDNVPYVKLFEDDISPTTVQDLIDDIHDHDNVRLYFSTDGGMLIDTMALIDYLNSRGDSLTLILSGYLQSAGGIILEKFTGKVELSYAFEFVDLHLVDRETLNFRDKLINSKLVSSAERWNIDYINWWKKFYKLTAKEVRELKEGKDIRIYRDRIEKII